MVENQGSFDENRLSWSAQGLRNQIRQQIFQTLATKNSCSFNELKSYLNIPQPKLAYHLQILIKNNIITNFYDKREGIKDHSFYDLTAFGRELLSDLSSPIQFGTGSPEETEQKAISPEFTNFRTINRVEYKSIKNTDLKYSTDGLKVVKEKTRKYFDPLIDCDILIKATHIHSKNKVSLPAMRKYYSSYKNPFTLKQKIEQKY
jgi:predicted transcriptional regulator